MNESIELFNEFKRTGKQADYRKWPKYDAAQSRRPIRLSRWRTTELRRPASTVWLLGVGNVSTLLTGHRMI